MTLTFSNMAKVDFPECPRIDSGAGYPGPDPGPNGELAKTKRGLQMMNFKSIEYLKTGSPRQQLAYKELIDLGIMQDLSEFNPVLTGTIPIGIDLPGSDLDIICECKGLDAFSGRLKELYTQKPGFRIRIKEFHGIPSVVANFRADNFEIEIFGQSLPVENQYAYRHMLIEYRLLEERGADFRKEIIRFKMEGYKTEPAFAKVLGLKGDPYQVLLEL